MTVYSKEIGDSQRTIVREGGTLARCHDCLLLPSLTSHHKDAEGQELTRPPSGIAMGRQESIAVSHASK
jgi:hypothetical protein